MSRFVAEPAIEPIRSYFSQLCVLLTGIASGGVDARGEEAREAPAFQMGRRDGYHVVVAHLASSATLLEAADKCAVFGRGVEERALAHPYGPDWSRGFAQATHEAALDIAMYAATEIVPPVDQTRLRAARMAARYLSPLHALRAVRPVGIDAVPPTDIADAGWS